MKYFEAVHLLIAVGALSWLVFISYSSVAHALKNLRRAWCESVPYRAESVRRKRIALWKEIAWAAAFTWLFAAFLVLFMVSLAKILLCP